ncbi:MAG TPA: enolase C-terminal domain-like protein [Burkholderiales bacterium]|nr:enolase C-terminal domain-like protein [Burkholderiales bacterium]
MKTGTAAIRLTLESVQVQALSVPLRRPIVSRVGEYPNWPFILIDVHTREGVVGRSYLEPYVHKAVKPIAQVIENIAGEFIGKPIAPLDVYGGAMKTLHLNGRQGMTLIALSGLDMAIWDALARAAGLPLATLLGGSPGPVRAYNTNGLWLIPKEKLASEARSLVEEGNFRAIKMRLGRPSLKDDIEAIRIVRDAVGDDIILMSDFNQGLTFGEALQRMHGLDDQGLYWFEEPIVYDNYEGCAQIARDMKTPIQIGENIYGPREFHKAVLAKAADLYMPDLMRIGGVTGWMRSAAIAGAAGLPLSSHLYTPVSAQLLRVSESADWLEWSDWAEPFLAEPFLAKDGHAIVPDTPGNGLDWDEAAVKKYAM